MMDSRSWPQTSKLAVETVIVGGGIAGLSSAYHLGQKDFLLLELSDRLGGTSAATSHQGIPISQGAHYELEYPSYYGSEVLQMLESLNIIQYQGWRDSWSFVDQQHIIPEYRKQRCYENGKTRKEVIQDGAFKKRFKALVGRYQGHMPLPTRLIDHQYRKLDKLTFFEFVSKEMSVDDRFIKQLDYHMLDDYGGTSRQVSALAGIHYFACRPYFEKDVQFFSPPGGNDYFIQKIANQLPSERLKLNHLVYQISRSGRGFRVQTLDVTKQQRKVIHCDRVIYAGQKHALKYTFPEEAELFQNSYAPWMVINFVTEQKEGEYGFWQNEYLGDRPEFIGFIDSSVQDQAALSNKRILTAYYCLAPEDHPYLATIPDHQETIIQEALESIENLLCQKLKPEAAYINVLGHAMAIPQPGSLFRDATKLSKNQMIYAGVDNGRLPLLFEALDSGLVAAKNIS